MTLSVRGYQRSHFAPLGVTADQFGKTGSGSNMTRLAKTVLSETLVVTEFAQTAVQNGQSEYAFSLDLPD